MINSLKNWYFKDAVDIEEHARFMYLILIALGHQAII